MARDRMKHRPTPPPAKLLPPAGRDRVIPTTPSGRPLTPPTVLRWQTDIGNAAVSLVVQRYIPSDRSLRQTCLDRSVFQAMTDDDLVQTIAAIDRITPGLTDDADRTTAEQNRHEARRQQAVRRYSAFEALGTGIEGAHDAAARRTAVEALVTWSRAQFDGFPQLIRRYRQQSGPDATEKVRVLGRAAAAVARMEYLLGTMLHRGGSWETTTNAGPMIDDYTSSATEWCSAFATNALQEIYGAGMQARSGYKIANPDQFADVEINYDTAQGGAFIGTRSSRQANASNNPFVGLRESLKAVATGADTEHTADEVATDFLNNRIRPQAGDLVVIRRGSADPNSFSDSPDPKKRYKSHTLIVESMSGTRMSLIEGNAGPGSNRVTGRVLDLSVADDVEEIVFISRPSLTSGLNSTDAAAVGTVETAPADLVTADQIQAPIDDLNLLLEDLARGEGDVSHGPIGGTVAEAAGNP